MKKRRAQDSRLGIAVGLLAAGVSLLAALEFPNPASGAGAAAFGANPALLGSARRPHFTYQLLNFNAAAGNNSFRATQYNRYTGAYLDSLAKMNILGSVPNTGLQLDAGADLDGLAFTSGVFGLAARGHAAASGTIPKDIMDLALHGNQLDRRYSAATLAGEAIAYSDVTVGVGIPLTPAWTTGVGLKYLRGIFIAQNTDVDGYLLTTPYVINSEVLAGYRWAQGGNGYGLDWGATYEFSTRKLGNPGRVVCGLAVLNLNTGINWSRQPGAAVFRVNLDSVNLVRLTSQHGAARTEYTSSRPAAFTSRLPCFLNVGATCEPVHRLTVGLSVLEGFQNTALSSAIPVATLSAEYRGLRWLPLNVALTVGGHNGFEGEAGLGFEARGVVVQGRVANLGGIALAARGLAAGISISYQAWAPGVRDGDTDVMRLYYDPLNGSKEE